MTSIKNMLTQALKAESLGLARVPSLVNKGIREVRERIFSLSSAVIDGSVTWATQPDGPTDDEILNNVVDHVDEAQTQTNEALDSEDVEELVEAQTAIEAALDDVDMLQDLSEDSELNQELNDTYEDLNARLQEIQDQIQDVERDLFGDEVRPSTPTQSARPKRSAPKKDPSQTGFDFDDSTPPPARAWSFSQTDAGVTAVSGPRGDVKNVMSTLQAKIDQYAADEQLYGISVTFKVEEKSTGSVSASRKGKTITIKVNGAPSISDLINAVSTPLAAIYDEQDIDFDEDGLSLAQELAWS